MNDGKGFYGTGHGVDTREVGIVQDLKKRLQDLCAKNRMKLDSDFYLYQWLKAQKFNVNKTEVAIRESFKWRQENQLSTDAEDFPNDLLAEFPADETTFSKTGMPIVTLFAAKWDVRTAIARRDELRVVRYVNLRTVQHEHMWVEHNEKLIKMSGNPMQIMESPENIILIVSATDLSIKQVTTPKAVECFIQFVKNIATKFPKMVGDIIFINFTKLYYIALNVVRPFLTFARIQIFDCNEEKWKKALFEFTSADQLTKEFGGTRNLNEETNPILWLNKNESKSKHSLSPLIIKNLRDQV